MFHVGDRVQTTYGYQKIFNEPLEGTVIEVILDNCLSNHFLVKIKTLYGTETLSAGWLTYRND